MEKAIVLSNIEFYDFLVDLVTGYAHDIIDGYAKAEDFANHVASILEEWMRSEGVEKMIVLDDGYRFHEIQDEQDLFNFVRRYYEKTMDDFLKEMLEEIEKLQKKN